MRVTLKTIAEEAGVSITTVSRALAGYGDVNEQTRRRIIEIAERLGYQPNLTARHLRSKRTYTIGMVIPRTAHYSDPFFMELVAGVGKQAAEHGYDLLLSAQMQGEEELSAYRRMVGGGRVDGMIVARVLWRDPRIAYLRQVFHPFVAFGRSEDANHPYIDVDGAEGIYQLVTHLAEYGHARIALIQSPQELAFTADRRGGYQRGLETLGLPYREEYVVQGDLTRRSGRQAAERLLGLSMPPSAIIACNDLMALGASETVQEHKLRVGQDIAIAGFDDIPEASTATPPLTTVRQPIYGIGYRLVDMLVELMRHASIANTQVLLQPELVIRASSGRLPTD